MKSLLSILATVSQHRDHAVLVTLVKTEGSTYRKPGARMLVLPGCRTVGTISGGCLEGAAARQAWELTRNQRRALFILDHSEDDSDGSWSLGCRGKLFLLAEPFSDQHPHPVLAALPAILRCDHPAFAVHEFMVDADGMLVPGDVRIIESSQDAAVRESGWRESATEAQFLELLPPQPHLLICGAGDDARPLASLADELGYRVTILDSRERLATRERFPDAHAVSAEGPAAAGRFAQRNTAAVIMSHRFADDLEYLAQLAAVKLRYLGQLGPTARTGRLLQRLAERNIRTHNLQAPAGFPSSFPTHSPESIALAILAQIESLNGSELKH